MQWTQTRFGVSGWRFPPTRIPTPSENAPMASYRDEEIRRIPEAWCVSFLPECPTILTPYLAASTYHTSPDVLPEESAAGVRTYTFDGASGWFEVGLQVFLAAGWRPDCAVTEGYNSVRAAPPEAKGGGVMVYEMAMKWLSASEAETLEGLLGLGGGC